VGALRTSRFFWVLALLVGTAAPIPSLHAQEVGLFRLRRWGGTVRLRFEGERRFSPELTQRPTFREAIALRNRGFVISPRLLAFQWNGDLSLFQERYTGAGLKQSSAGRLLSHNFMATILQRSAYPFTFVWTRNSNVINLTLGGRSRYDISRVQAALNMRGLSLPSLLRVQEQNLKEEWTRAGWTTRRNQVRRTLKYEGRRRSDGGSLDLSYDLLDVLDRIRKSLSYTTHLATARMRRAFGSDRSNEWNSSLRLFRRRGLSDYDNARLEETLRLRHLPSLTSRYHYTASVTRTANVTSLLQSAFASLSHRLYSSLNTNVGAGGTFGSFSLGKERTLSVNGGTQYAKTIPLSGRLSLGYARAYSLTDRAVPSLVQQVFHEVHVFVNGLPILLNERNVLLGSIVVSDEAGEIIFEEGEDRDYVVRQFGDRVEIYRNPLGRIEENATVVVDYQFRTPPSMRFRTDMETFNAGLSWSWLSLYYRVSRHDQDLLSGSPTYASFLENLSTRTAGAAIELHGRRGRLSVVGEYRDYSSNSVAYESLTLRNSLSYRPMRFVGLSASMTLSFLSHTRLKRDITVYAYRSTLQFRPARWFQLEAFGRYRIRRETAVADEDSYEYGGTLRSAWRVTNLFLSYQRRRWQFGTQLVDEHRFIAEIQRIF